MRDYGKIKTSLWTNARVGALTAGKDARTLLVYLFTNRHGTLVGSFVLPFGYVAEDLGWDLETVRQRFAELTEAGFVDRDEVTRLVRIPSWWEHNTMENVNVGKAAIKLLRGLPKCATLARAIKDLERFLERFPKTVAEQMREAFGKDWRTVPKQTTKPVPTIEPEQKPEPEPEPEPKPEARAARSVGAVVDPVDEAFERFWVAHPNRGLAPHNRPNPKKPALERFRAAVRDGVDPEMLVRAAGAWARADRDEPRQTVAQAMTWLSQARWQQYGDAAAVVVVIGPDTWRERLGKYHGPGKFWPKHLGPAPGEPGCRVPPELLAELDSRPADLPAPVRLESAPLDGC